MTNNALRLSLVFGLALPLAACELEEEGMMDIDVEGCEHLQMGPTTAVTAAATADPLADTVDSDHRRYDIDLPAATGGGNEGFVLFAAGNDASYVFFMNTADVNFEVQDSGGGNLMTSDRRISSPICTEIGARETASLTVATFFLRFTSDTVDSVQLVVEELDPSPL